MDYQNDNPVDPIDISLFKDLKSAASIIPVKAIAAIFIISINAPFR